MKIAFQGLGAQEGACAGSYTSMYSLCAKPDCRAALTDVLGEITERAKSLPGIVYYSCGQSRKHPDVFQIFSRRKRIFPASGEADSTLTPDFGSRLRQYSFRPTRDRLLSIGLSGLTQDTLRPAPKIAVSVAMVAKPNCVSALPAVLEDARNKIGVWPGNIKVEHSQSMARPDFFHCYTEWKNLPSLEAYLASAMFQQVTASIVENLSSRTLDVLDVIGYSEKSA